MTLEGTRTFIIGMDRVAVIDPGPDDPSHLDAVADMAAGAVVAILLTHSHPDHAAGADDLAARIARDAGVPRVARAPGTGVPVLGMARGTLGHGAVVSTDAGDIVAVHTPGHTPDHVCFHWLQERAIFCGDLMMGGLDTALVAAPEGDLQEYLRSLEVLRDLDPVVIHPAHGPSFEDPAAAIDRYIRHRADRQTQVLDALSSGAHTPLEIAAAMYGDSLPPGLRDVAVDAVRAYLQHLERLGSVERDLTGWRRGE